ncbi:hypothetical protein RND81_10G241800 [Saponaria officinalis]|uniref:Uncharacterized protein n=1 Tax=Saponaria officinalis TaxID=3572 RepID=A0AAW1I7X7_SAPOF
MDHNDPYLQWYRRVSRVVISPLNSASPANYDLQHNYWPIDADFRATASNNAGTALNKNNPRLKIISDCFIKPNFESKTPHYLSSNDLLQISANYMHRGFVYAKPSSSFSMNTFVDNLKQSISLALVDFYPLSGRLETVKYPDDHSSWVYVDCNTGSGASIPRLLWSLFDLGEPNVVNYDGHSRALLSVQVTELVDGVFIGFTMNHCLGDGTLLWCFINALSKIFMNQMTYNSNNNNNKPDFKAVFSDENGPIIKLPYLDPNEFIIRSETYPRLRIRVFRFSAESIALLKAQANQKSDTQISSFQALCAFTWISIIRARNQPNDSNTHCFVIANTRPKHDPPVLPNHFGNFVELIMVTSKVNELKSNRLCRASMLINKAVMGLDTEVIRAKLKARDERPEVPHLTQLSKFDAYGAEFGLGKPVATRPGYAIWMNGMIVVDPGCEGGGSADLHVCLLSKIMDVLECDHEFMSYVS